MMDLDELLRPIAAERFVREIYGRAPMVFRPELALQSDAVWADDAWHSLPSLRNIDAAGRDDDDQHTQRRIEASSIAGALERGETICADITSHAQVRAWLDDAARGLGVGTGGFAKLYVSPDGAGFPLHFDPHHVFVVQCQGSKRWSYGAAPALPYARENAKINAAGAAVFSGRYEGIALYGGDGAVAAPTADAMREVTLQPGDALYLPPGTWHSACAIGRSVAISLSPPRLTPYDLVLQWLEGHSLAHPEWFVDLHPERPSDVANALKETLGAMRKDLGGADVTTLLRQWALRLTEGAIPEPEASVKRSDVLVRPAPLPALEADGGALVFFGAGQEWSLPAEAKPFVKGLGSTKRFVAEDALLWDENLRWPAAKEILDALVRAGVLRRE